jgi:hypothetical protein
MNDKVTCIALVLQNRKTLDDIGRALLQAIALATQDFLLVHALYKDCYESPHPGLRNAIAVSGIAEDLQYVDILKQKTEHVLALHRKLADDTSFQALSGAILKLNLYQIRLADFDFNCTVETIQSKIKSLRQMITDTLGAESMNKEYFRHTFSVSGAMQKAGAQLLSIVSQCVLLPASDLMTLPISSLYSMESERFVLRWVVENRCGSYDDLLREYKDIRKVLSTELF